MKNKENKKRVLKFDCANIDGKEVEGLHDLAQAKENDSVSQMFAFMGDDKYELKTEVVGDKFHIYLDGQMFRDSMLGYTPDQFRAALDEANGMDVVVNINSSGGAVTAGSEIATMLGRYQGKTTAVATGDVASAATFVAAAADEFLLDKNAVAHVMFHKPMGIAYVSGRSDTLKRTVTELANSLDAIQADMAKVMANKTGKTEEEMNKWLNDSISLSSAQAIEEGFADGYVDYKETNMGTTANSKGLYLVVDGIEETAPAASSEHSDELAAVASLDVPSAGSDDLKKVASLALV